MKPADIPEPESVYDILEIDQKIKEFKDMDDKTVEDVDEMIDRIDEIKKEFRVEAIEIEGIVKELEAMASDLVEHRDVEVLDE